MATGPNYSDDYQFYCDIIQETHMVAVSFIEFNDKVKTSTSKQTKVNYSLLSSAAAGAIDTNPSICSYRL